MRVLIGNTVKTDISDYSFGTREEAEAFYMTLKVERGAERKTSKPPKASTRTVRAKPSVGT
jgi:hypothetical protein